MQNLCMLHNFVLSWILSIWNISIVVTKIVIVIIYVWFNSFIQIIIITFFTKIEMKYLTENKLVKSCMSFNKCN